MRGIQETNKRVSVGGSPSRRMDSTSQDIESSSSRVEIREEQMVVLSQDVKGLYPNLDKKA